MCKLHHITSILILLCGCKSVDSELSGHLGRPDISPDGKKIAFIYAKDASNDVWEIYSADITGKNVVQLTHFPEARIKKGPVWSPDGKQLAFHADIAGGAQIFVMDSDGKNLVQLTHSPGYNVEPHWSPDGSKIVYNLSIPEAGTVQMLSMNSDGTNVELLPNPDGQNWYPRIIANDRVVFTSDVHHRDFYDIFTMNPDSSDIRQLTTVKAINWFPEHSPDGSQIAFTSNRDDPELSDSGNYNIYIMNHDGNDIRQITDLPGQEIHPKWHPSGDKLIFEWHKEQPMGLYMLDLHSSEIKKIRLTY